MGERESDYSLVIPDTPDRMKGLRREENAGKGSNLSSSFILSRRANNHRSSNRFPHIEGNDADSLDTESLFRRAELASMMSNSHEVGTSSPHDQLDSSNMRGTRKSAKVVGINSRIPLDISYPTRCRNTDRKNGKHFHEEGCSHSCNLLNEVPSSPTFGSKLFSGRCRLDEFGLEASGEPVFNHDSAASRRLKCDIPLKSSQRRLVRNGHISPCNTAKCNSPFYGGKVLSEGNCPSKEKGIDLASDLGNKASKSSYVDHLCDSDQKPPKLAAENSLIFPSKTENITINGTGKVDQYEISHGKSSSSLHVISPDSDHFIPDKGKGKGKLDESWQASDQDSIPRPSRRLALKSAKESNLTGTLGEVCTKGAGWKSTRSRRNNVPNGVLEANNKSDPLLEHAHENSGEKEHANLIEDSSEIKFFEASSMVHQASTIVPVSITSGPVSGNTSEVPRNNGSRKFLRGKRKSGSARVQHAESSTSDVFESTPFPNATSTRNHSSYWRSIDLPVIDVDQIPSPILVQNSDDSGSSSSKDLQVESDELLARQLQEQLFNEDAEQIDARLAWTLQQEEDAQQTYFVGSRPSPSRDVSIAHLYGHYPQLQNSLTRTSNAARASSRVAQLRRNLNRRHMDLESRLNYLEELEAAFDDGNDRMISNRLHRIQRDFNEGDYEMLLSLDDDNHHHVGASVHQINSLPLSVIQGENSDEACAVCLEPPSIGDTMRHLPCMHKFHKDCIDNWLRRKTSCPICKSGIA